MKTATTNHWWTLLGAGAIIVLWQLAALRLPPIILPSPGDTVGAFTRLLIEPLTLRFISASLVTFLIGIAIATSLGFGVGLIMGLSSSAAAALSPVMALLNAIPTIAWMGIAMMWFGLGMGPTVFLVVVTTLPVLVIAVSGAIRVDNSTLDDVARVYGVGRRAKLRYLILPPLKTVTVTALVAMAALGWKITIMGEFLTASNGLGSLLLEAKAHLQTDKVFAITLLLIGLWAVMSMILEACSQLAQHRPATRIARSARRHQLTAAQSGGMSSGAAAGDLTCRSVALSHDDRLIAEELTFTIRPGTTTAILGPSGVGKTTLLRVLSGLHTPAAGEISPRDRAVAYVFQDDRLIPWLTVADNLALTSGADAEHISQQLALIGIEGSEDLLIDELSGGMRRRVALARGFLHNADTLLLDEPFSGLDPLRRSALTSDIEDLRAAKRQAIVFVTHDIDDALLLADQVLVLRGAPAGIFARFDLSGMPRPRALNTQELNTTRHALWDALTTTTTACSTSTDAPHHTRCAEQVLFERNIL
ncbi:MAG: ATP-binding cassette domain-containing protein [Yaniella sp.]|uniref:ATP-binding cassette domain-containing protein n=1 Tax=Yaniella sp. TaxID=2773929 RepID=UPI0026487F78|nr:ATP-binding cassette domain-containing protein [Yaniella sp.]MDN6758268.1 ATP-binding cassette domain-containing protein [Yaniella sp.]